MTKQEYMEQGEQYLLHTYNRFPVVLERGEGVYLYDTDGKEYLDFAAGIAVFALGYQNEKYNAALTEQIGKVIHTSNLFYNGTGRGGGKEAGGQLQNVKSLLYQQRNGSH